MYANLINNLDELGFTEVEPYMSDYLSKVSKEGISVQDALINITDREIKLRNKRAAQIQVSVSHFPYVFHNGTVTSYLVKVLSDV